MDKNQAIKKLAHELMFYGCQKLTVPLAYELAESVLDNKVPFLKLNNGEEFKDNVALQAEATKNAATEALAKFVPEKLSEEAAFEAEVKHWHKVFISASLSRGSHVEDCITRADIAIEKLYGKLDFKLTM